MNGARRRRFIGGANTVTSLLAWVHLYILTMLLAWVGLVVSVTGWNPVVITSGSMEPTLRVGDIVVVDTHPDDELVGQRSVITFEAPGGEGDLITHRVVEVQTNTRTYVTQGDANISRDTDPVPADEVTGVARLVVPLIGLPILWATEGNAAALGAMTVLTLTAVVIAARSLALTRRNRGERRRSSLADTALRRVRLLVGVMIISQYFLDGGRFEVQALGFSRLQLMVTTLVGLVLINMVSSRLSRGGDRSSVLDVFELAADTVLVVMLITATGGGGIGWVLIALPIIEAAVRFQLAGALIHWMVMAAVTISLRLWALTRVDASVNKIISELEQVLDQLGVLLLVAIPGAYLAEQLTGEVFSQRRATREAEERGRLLEHVAVVGRRINRLGTELFASLIDALEELGFANADILLRLEDGSWTTLASSDTDEVLPRPGRPGSGVRPTDLELTEAIVDADDPEPTEIAALEIAGLEQLVRLTLSTDGDTSIVLRAGQRTDDPDFSGQLEVLRLLCAQATVALQNNQLMDDLQSMHVELAHQANHDALTGLPNRASFMTQIRERLEAPTEGLHDVVLFLDLNGFKAVNDTLGHEAGDQLLQLVAERFTNAIGDTGTVARLGGDEFTVLLEPVETPQAAREAASRLHAVLTEPFTIGSERAVVATSIGIAYSDGEIDESELLRRADAAMYAAKATGGAGHTVWYDTTLDEGDRRRGRLAAEFRKALELGQLELHYQPIVDTTAGLIIGAEALLRWNHHELGAVPANETLELAVTSQRVDELNRWILETAVGAVASFDLAPEVPFQLAINVSPAELESSSLVGNVNDVLLLSGVDPSRIVIELSERMVAEEPETRAHIDELAQLGISLSLDDFGQGNTSLAHFRGLPIDQIKLDRLLVDNAVGSETDRIILGSVTSLAHELDMEVIAEGIETDAHRAIAAAAGVDVLQGYALHRPMPYDQLRALLVRGGMVQPGARTTRRESGVVATSEGRS